MSPNQIYQQLIDFFISYVFCDSFSLNSCTFFCSFSTQDVTLLVLILPRINFGVPHYAQILHVFILAHHHFRTISCVLILAQRKKRQLYQDKFFHIYNKETHRNKQKLRVVLQEFTVSFFYFARINWRTYHYRVNLG